MRERRHSLRLLAVLCGVAAVLILAACGSKSTSSSSTSSGSNTTAQAKKGGAITVLEDSGFAGAWPAGLIPPPTPTARPTRRT
jgi:ABC-type oligopeptide transport system substrate-binding subunit